MDPLTSGVLVGAGESFDEAMVEKVETAGVEVVMIRSVLTCESKEGVCGKCYGRDLARGTPVNIGEAVGVIAAQSIGEPGTQLTMRTFHIGGTASRVSEQSRVDAKNNGTVRFINMVTVRAKSGHLVAMNRSGSIAVVDERGREKERYQVVYGARLRVRDGEQVKLGELLAEWDPYTYAILTEIGGTAQFKDLQEGITLNEEVDEVTGLSRLVVAEAADEKRQPALVIKGAKGNKRYLMPSRAHLMVQDGEEVFPGDILAKIPRETTRTKDITGGLPRVVELFEARKPRETAIISEIDGVVKFGEVAKGQRKIYVTADNGEEKEYSVPRGIHVNVQEGERLKAGEPLMDGPLNP
ncbi:MAG: DNA-directed RNA polymerase subunit beta', partial [Acetobacteraceae bacterium]